LAKPTRSKVNLSEDAIWIIHCPLDLVALFMNWLFVLQFEKTADHLFEAAYFGQKDVICGKSCIDACSLNILAEKYSHLTASFYSKLIAVT